MTNPSSTIVQRLWNYCNVLRDDGMSYGDYVEQLTYLLFLKMDDENGSMLGKASAIPAEFNWASLLRLDGDELERHYRQILAALGAGAGLIPVIFRKAQNKIQDPAKLQRLVELIDGETWIGLDIDVKGEIYEGLLEKNAQDTKSGAGQYFTPRPLIKAIVDVMRPRPGQTICDPACGTGGFLLAAHDYIAKNNQLDRDQWQHLQPRRPARLGDRRQHRPPVRDEPVPARHRRQRRCRRGGRRPPGHFAHPRRRQPGGPPRAVLRHGADQPALRQEVQRHLRHRRGRDPPRVAEHRAR